MPGLEDSGIDSEDKQSTAFDVEASAVALSGGRTTASHSEVDLEVVFRGASTNANASNARSQSPAETTPTTRPEPPNTCRVLQRKLELKVARAKRNYSQYQEEQAKKTQSAHLIPIDRLSIPGELRQKPLVDYQSETSDSEVEEISFFPAKLKGADKRAGRQQAAAALSDTFSIQEVNMDSEPETDDSDGSQTLELLPPVGKLTLLDRLRGCGTTCFCWR